MKKFIVAIIFHCLFSIHDAIAQDSLYLQKYYPKPLISSIEFLVGPNSSTIRGIDPSFGIVGNVYYATTFENRVGYSFGFSLVHGFTKHFKIQAIFLWESKGIKGKRDSISLSNSPRMVLGNATLSTEKTNNDYVTLSLIPQLLLGKRSRFNIGVGGYIGILNYSRVKIKYYYPIARYVNQEGAFDKYDFGLSLSCGYSFYLNKKTQLTFQFLNGYGLKQVSIFHNLYSWAPRLYTNSYSLMIGVRMLNNKLSTKFNKL